MITEELDCLFNILNGSYGEILETHAMWECIAALGVKPQICGGKWAFIYGNVCGMGETIFKAAWEFYTKVKTENAIPCVMK